MKIKDIAKLAGVSPATVSRVMNNNGYVKHEKRQAVEKVIREVGYQPNEIAKSLKNQKSHMIGVIVPKISTETASRVVDGITKVAKQHNYQLIIANTNLQIEEEIKYLKFLSNKLVDGIIMMATEVTDEHKKLAQSLAIPIVMVGQHVEGFTSIVHDDYRAAKLMIDHIIACGHKDIGFIGVDPKDIAVGQVRKQAYIDRLHEAGLSINLDLIGIGDFSIESGYKQMEGLLTRGKPTAVMAVTDHLAIGAIHCLHDQGLSVPNDVSVAGLGDVKLAKYFSPPLTTVHYGFKTSGIVAAEHVFNMIKQKQVVSDKVVIDFEVKIRKSVTNLKS
ncbi:LacI family DNA-binding transcriptional regulator [Amphibacillus cookii]|uniref:LacI family DNA-binding transcriptional regulator n=1 Tax=Amphibacillus cookii TaxID=767787 RepID=UPI00195BE048|nr:LacI family DNA-binding transcriptional regulator [Amphibacillus cookii]MBM7540137.1 LacI family sucrose operon transcriptional repressor [Amphibacillus cookii]